MNEDRNLQTYAIRVTGADTGLGVEPTQAAGSSRIFLTLLWTVIAVYSIVPSDPALADIGIVILFMYAAVSNRLFIPINIGISSLLLAVFMGCNLVAIWLSADADTSLRFFAGTVYLLVSWFFFLGTAAKQGGAHIRRLMNGYVVGGLVACALTMFSFWVKTPLSALLLYDAYRAKGFFKDPNVFGPFLVPAVLYCVSIAISQRSRFHTRLLALFGVVLSTAGVLFSFSRGAYVNYVVALSTFLGLTLARTLGGGRRRIYMLASVVLIGGVSAHLATSPNTASFLEQRLQYQQYDEIRFANYQLALETGLERMIGVGPGMASTVLQIGAHNTFLLLLVEYGVLGLLVFSLFLGLSVVRCCRSFRACRSDRERQIYIVIFASLIGVLINGMFIDTFHWRHLWFLLALSWCPISSRRAPYLTRTRPLGPGLLANR